MMQQEESVQEIKALGPYLISENPPHYLTTTSLADVPEMVRILNINKDVYNGTATFEFPYLASHATARIGRALEYHTSMGHNTHYAMRTSPSGPMIGWIAFYFPTPSVTDKPNPRTGQPFKIGDIGYWVSPEYYGQGYTKRSALFVVHEIMFKLFDCDAARAEAYTHNTASRKVMAYSGMKVDFEAKTVFIPKLQKDMEICRYIAYRTTEIEEEMTKI
ncbi:hypothetical protein BG004_003933 [Podila humilis]|nr:hypothetical protein BG004_003933 [Podila humilis]